MSYASIMVHMDREPGAARRAKLAAGLADLFDANLIGVAARRPSLNETDLDDDVVLKRKTRPEPSA